MNGRPWTREEIARLYAYAETGSQRRAARLLGRSVHSVSRKVCELGIRWRQGAVSLAAIAQQVGCSPTSVRRCAQILYPDDLVVHAAGTNGARWALTHEQAERVRSVLVAARKHREQKISAGRARWRA